MAEIKTIYKGESVTLLFTFPEAYDMTRIISHKVFVGETEFTGVVEGQSIRMQLKSSDTNRMIGTHRIVCLIDDTTLGLRKPYCGELVIAKTQASGSNASVSNISDIIIPLVISETAIQANTARDGANSAAQSATNLVNSYATDLAAKELKANKQNSLTADGTGTKFPTVDAVNAGLGDKIGTLLVNYTHSLNKEVVISEYDVNTDTFTSIAHGLENNNIIAPTINSNIFGIIPMTLYVGGMENVLYYVVNKTADTFQLSKTNGGAPINLTTIATTDLSKWHFEKMSSDIVIDNLPNSKKLKIILSGKNIKSNNYYVLPMSIYQHIWYSNIPSMNAPVIYPGFADCGCYLEIDMQISPTSYYYVKGRSISNNTISTFAATDINLAYFTTKNFSEFTSIIIMPVNGILFNGFNVKIYKA